MQEDCDRRMLFRHGRHACFSEGRISALNTDGYINQESVSRKMMRGPDEETLPQAIVFHFLNSESSTKTVLP
jgi:hypothetical protein